MVSNATRPYWYRDNLAPPEVHQAQELGLLPCMLLGFLSGALAILPFQEATLLALHRLQAEFPLLVWAFGPTAEFGLEADLFGLPQLGIEMLRGGCMGMPLAVMLCRGRPVPMLAAGALYGIGAVAGLLLVAMPAVRGLPAIGHLSREMVCLTLLVCAGWGWGTALMLKAVTRR